MGDDAHWMSFALEEAERAFAEGEVPVGAVVVRRNRVVGRGHNRTENTGYPFEHAEVLAMREAVGEIGRRSLEDCVLYSTVEPCVMCVGAALLARIPRIVFGAREPNTGACESMLSVPNDPALGGVIVVTGGVAEERSRELMQAFFRLRRAGGPGNGSDCQDGAERP
jgi:tRNA(adenine34) deaminase